MTFRHGKTTLVVLGTDDISQYLNDSSVTDETEANETTTYGLGAKRYMPGLEDVSASLSGLYDSGEASEDGVDQILEDALKSDELQRVLIVPDSPALLGRRCVFFDAVHTSFEISNPVADVVTISADFQGSNGSALALLLADLDPIAASATLDSVDGGSYPSTRAIIRVHVLANDSDGDVTLQVEQSDDDTTFLSLGDPIVVPAGEKGVFTVTVDGSDVEQYLQLDVTKAGTTGSATIVAAAARL